MLFILTCSEFYMLFINENIFRHFLELISNMINIGNYEPYKQ